ncbi:hypothetical protein DI09_126p10 [Mitosporidium daphniae]|uniref:PIK helical domain-containing protein n=1 Tax=Mitosporidium daphniae TaxID=1485682 RepID=A0A098VVE4_9MICR|nr:uncharacterized protein DI09_126p10 [Mitosporidium daphniae]KGG52902.1 hypothetical protein DI09_126p10 [Mitosporidium daphniae]|eukprot:XP_013239338.1 uncharacterized protein DI09_126p10 [Mitosporidium daphniae]
MPVMFSHFASLFGLEAIYFFHSYSAQLLSPILCMKILVTYSTSPVIQDFAIRSLLKHGPNVNFFYIPQLVQLLRHDSKGAPFTNIDA